MLTFDFVVMDGSSKYYNKINTKKEKTKI